MLVAFDSGNVAQKFIRIYPQLGARMKADADGAVSELCAVMTSVRFTVVPDS